MNVAVSLDQAGRLVLPAAVRKALGLKPGSRLVLSVRGQVVSLTPMREAIRKAQAILAAHRPKDGHSVADDLVAERRAEAAREYE